jgi:hypothetical protein
MGRRELVWPVQVVETAYTSTITARSAAFTFTESARVSSTSGSSETQTVTGSGQGDFATHAFDMTVNSPAGGAIKLVETAGILYLQVPVADKAQIPGGKPWAEIDLNQVDESNLGASFAQLRDAGNNSPTQVLANLTAISNQVTLVGAGTVDGVATTEYKAEIDLNKVASQAGSASSKAAQAVQQEEKALGTTTLPVEVWVDAHHLVRQIQTEEPVPAASSGATNGSGEATLTIMLTQYGTPANITPPPAADVANITSQVISQTPAG